MKSNRSQIVCSLLVMVFLMGLLGCGKPRLFGKDQASDPIVKIFPIDSKAAFQAAKEALAFNGYNIQTEDDKQGILETHWQPSTSDSHYVWVFNRKDRGTVGSYHRLIVKVTPKGTNESQVEIYSLAKSFISNLKSTGVEEQKVLAKIADFTRKANIDTTNVGLQ